ncbi:OmpA family protein [Pseudomonas yamanorum]|uniref:Type VI secretion system ImpA family N-terminal domain-containing protein n=1 Tax=Pseudomonas yamanorum TaxID=515393 RepID=A0A7Y8EM00_9PSED|nr:OmpA family protein [Pseudomonas yamanorum]NWE17108.1 type VI secretion system ImpA family N-terminal domain-containing protein [Pseudomonas yamanorum]
MTALFEMRVRVGGDPRGFGEFTALRDELAKLSHPACPDVDWAKVEQLCLTLFQNNGAELQTAAAFALARSQRYGLEGMAHGVTLIEALCSEWTTVWPPKTSVRLGILAWLFGQWQPLLRRVESSCQAVLVLERLGGELDRLAAQLDRQGQAPLVSLQALRHQVGSLMRRLERSQNAGGADLMLTSAPEPAFVLPVVILPALPMPELPPAVSRKSRIVLWLFALITLMALGGGCWWWVDQRVQPQPAVPDTVHLDSLSLFDAGSIVLKPGSTKVLINALVNIKAQPGWLIVIVGHTDTTGDAEQNLQLSYARASAVRDWMQRMGDLPDNCFAVQGAAGKQPIASNDTASGRAANRRVDIRLMPQAQACALSETGEG